MITSHNTNVRINT